MICFHKVLCEGSCGHLPHTALRHIRNHCCTITPQNTGARVFPCKYQINIKGTVVSPFLSYLQQFHVILPAKCFCGGTYDTEIELYLFWRFLYSRYSLQQANESCCRRNRGNAITNQMTWGGSMISIRNKAENTILREMIYGRMRIGFATGISKGRISLKRVYTLYSSMFFGG